MSSFGSYNPQSSAANTGLSDDVRGQRAAAAANASLAAAKIQGVTYRDFGALMGAWSDAAQPLQAKYGTEINSQIYGVKDGWQVGPADSNGTSCAQGICTTNPLPRDLPGGTYWGFIHTHPTNLQGLSSADEDYTYTYNPDGVHSDGGHGSVFVSMPNGQINGWSPGMPILKDGSPNFSQYIVWPAQR